MGCPPSQVAFSRYGERAASNHPPGTAPTHMTSNWAFQGIIPVLWMSVGRAFWMVMIFGDFEFDVRRRSLRSAGRIVRVKGQVADLLTLLVERPGELITREEIQRRLWPDRNVEFDHSLDVIVSRLRATLGDRSPSPRYIETVTGKGYRFIEPVHPKPEPAPLARPRHSWTRRLATYVAVGLVAAVVAVLFARTRYDKFVPGPRASESPTSSRNTPANP
jgi:DNA-binding winged helix-turn-helix (wHTH) protein